jgi:hypothetical protein
MKKLFILIPVLTTLVGCGSFTKLKEIPFKGEPGLEIEGKIKRLNREAGFFTVQLAVKKAWYEGDTTVYERRGMLIASFTPEILKYPHVKKKTQKMSLYDYIGRINISVWFGTPGALRNVPFRKVVIADDMLKIYIDKKYFHAYKEDVYASFSLDSRQYADSLAEGRKDGTVRRTYVRLNSKFKICVTCKATKGI